MLLATLFFGAHSSAVNAAGGAGPTCTFTGAVSSAWGISDNWNCGIVPSSANDVIIPTGQSVDSSESGNAARGITIEAGGGLTVSGGTLEDQNSLQVDTGATFTMSAGYVSMNSQLSIYGTVEMNGGSILVLSGVNNFIGGTLTLNGGTLTSNFPFGNSGTINGSGTGALLDTAALVNSSDGVIDHTGGWQIRDSREFVNEGTYTSSADDSMFTFVGAPTTIPTNGIIYPNLRIQGSVNLEDGAILAVRRDVLLAADSVLTANSSTLVVPRNWEARGRIIRNHLTVEFTGSTTSTIEVPTNQALFYNLVVNKDVPDKGIQLLSDVTVLNDFAQTQGLLDENSFNLFLPEACLFTAGGGTSAWLLAANWDCDSVARIPRASDRVTIPTSQTVILGNATTTIQSLDLESGATFEIRSGGFLNISGTSTNAGTLNLTAAGAFPSPGLLALTGGVYGTSTNTGVIQASGQGTFEVDVPLINGGTIDMSAGGVLDLKENIHTLGDLDVSALGKLRISGSGSSRVIPAVTLIGFLEVNLVAAGDSVMLEQNATTTGGADLFTGSLYLSTHTLTFVNTAYLDAHEYGNFVAYGVDAGTIAFTGTGDQTITSQFYNSIQNTNIQINKTAGSVTQNAQTQYIGFEIVSGTYVIKAPDGEYADYGGYFSAQTSFMVHPGATVSSTAAVFGVTEGTNEGTLLLNNNGYTSYINGTFMNTGTATFGGDYGFYDTMENHGAVYLPADATVAIHDFINDGEFIADPLGTSLTLDSSFTAGIGSVFTAPQTTILNGPTALPAYSYKALRITSDVALVASTTVMATTTIASGVALDLGTNTLNAPGDILNEGLITSSTGALLSHPIDYIRFSDSAGDLASSFTDSDDLYITVKDQGRNLDGAVAETMFITATSTVPAGADSEVLTLTETAPSSGIFRNVSALPVHAASVVTTGNGTFEVMADGQGRTTYIDAFDPADSLSTSVDLVGEAIGAPPSDPPSPPISTGGGGGGGGTFSIQPVALANASGTRPSLQVLVNGSNASSSQTLQRTVRLDFNADPATVKGYAISLRSDFATAGITPYTSSLSYVLPETYGTYSIYTKFYSTTGEASAPIVRTVSYQPSTTTILVPDVSPVTSTVSDVIIPSSPAQIASAATRSLVEGDAKTFKVTLSSQDLERLSVFVEYGTSKESLALGFGERRAVIRDVFDTIGRAIPTEEIEKLIRGETASGSRNLAREQAQLLRSRATFRTIYGHDPNFKNANENLAWNVLMYRIRFPRNVAQEQRGILKFKSLFGKNPTDPFQWATVRVLAYIRM